MFITLFIALFWAQSSYAEIPNELEPDYAEAILAIHGKGYDRALQILDQLLKKSPQNVEFLELKALTEKTSNRIAQSEKTYLDLIRLKTAQKRPVKESAPYHFELGMIRFRQNKLDHARRHLQIALQLEFNGTACHFFLGMIEVKESHWSEAENHFDAVARSNSEELRPAAHFYLAQIASKTNYPAGASQNFAKARDSAQNLIDSSETNEETRKMAEQIRDAADQALAPLNRGLLFGSVSLLTGYDSNVLSIPVGISSSDATGKSSIKETLQVGIGYMTSPLKTIQWIPSYRGSMNYNFNRDSRTGEFIGNTGSLYISRTPLARFTPGLKLETSYLFQDTVDSDTNTGTFRPYLATLAAGPYAKWEVEKKMFVGMELFFSKQIYKKDSAESEINRRSGTNVDARFFWTFDQGKRFWNPSANLSFSNANTSGTDYRSRTFGFTFSNLVNFSEKSRLTLTAGYSVANYPVRSTGTRHDSILNLQAAASRKLNTRLTLLGDASYTHNGSNITDTYEYNRFAVSAGVSYSLF